MNKPQFVALDGVLYHLEKDKTLRVVPPTGDRRELFNDAHSGTFGGHLRDTKIHGQLSRHYWWPGMRKDIRDWCLACIPCATRHVGQAMRPPLTPIPIAGPFDRIGVDVIQFPMSRRGNRYAVVFMDYLTKWPEVFATSDQTAPTLARLLVEEVVSRHGVPGELLSDRGPAFLSKLVLEVCELLGTKKINTTAYHLQTDGLVERFNRTLTDMLSKTVSKDGKDWDDRLPYVLFMYRTSLQQSTAEAPFFLLYGRDARLPTEVALFPTPTRYPINLDDYKSEMVRLLSGAWELARQSVQKTQRAQKHQHDRKATCPSFAVGDRVFVYMPAAKSGKAHKFARPFKGPYRVLATYNNGVQVRLVDRPTAQPIGVALNRVHRCPTQIECGPANESLGTEETGLGPADVESEEERAEPEASLEITTPWEEAAESPEPRGPWVSRLRKRLRRQPED